MCGGTFGGSASDKRGFLCARGPVGGSLEDPFEDALGWFGNWLLERNAGDCECVRGELLKLLERLLANIVAWDFSSSSLGASQLCAIDDKTCKHTIGWL